jgi:hypothetical protein
MMTDELFDLLVEINVIVIEDLQNLAKIRAYIAKLQQEIADAKAATALALEQVAATQPIIEAAKAEALAAQVLADEAKLAQKAAEDAFAADQLSDAEVTAGLAELAASIPDEVVPVDPLV